MIPKSFRISAVAPTLLVLSSALIGLGCSGGETAPAPAESTKAESGAEKQASSAPKKTSKGVESEENTPKRFQDKN